MCGAHRSRRGTRARFWKFLFPAIHSPFFRDHVAAFSPWRRPVPSRSPNGFFCDLQYRDHQRVPRCSHRESGRMASVSPTIFEGEGRSKVWSSVHKARRLSGSDRRAIRDRCRLAVESVFPAHRAQVTGARDDKPRRDREERSADAFPPGVSGGTTPAPLHPGDEFVSVIRHAAFSGNSPEAKLAGGFG